MTTPDHLSLLGSRLRRRIREAIADPEIREYAPELLETINRYLARPARYVRPRLVNAAARAYGAEECGANSPVDRLSVATEMLHVFALLHDDRIDVPCREGEFAPGTALLAGDLLYTVGYGLIAETVQRNRLSPEILLQVRRIASRTVVGQAADVTFRRAHGDRPERADLYHLYDLKTGLYTIAAPLQIGALAAGCDRDEVAALEAVAIPLGRAFQMRDDLDDIVAAYETMSGRSAVPEIPPWELNLAVTFTAERARWRGHEPEEIHDDHAFLAELEIGELERFVDGEIEGLMGTCVRAIDHLSLPTDERREFRRELERTLTSLTFPSDEAYAAPRNHDRQ